MNHGLEGEDHLNDEEYARVHDFREPMSEAEEQAYWEIGDDLSFERTLRSRGYRVMRGWGDTVGEPIKVQSDSYVDFYRKMYGDQVLATGLSLLNLLRGDVWVTKESEKLTAKQMTPSHASNLKAWLERRARVVLIAAQLEAGCAEIDHDGGMHAHDAIEEMANELLEIDPLDHLRRLKLYKAICERATQVFVRG